MTAKIICHITRKFCQRDCIALGDCELKRLQREKEMELESANVFFIASHRLGAIEPVAKAMINNSNKRSRRVELNHIEQVLKTLKLIPHSTKVVSLGLGCLDTGDCGLLVVCVSPHQLSADIPQQPKEPSK